MRHLTEDIVTELEDLTKVQLEYLHTHVIPLNEADLEWRHSKERWNIFEVIEHLNRFGDFYFPKLTNAVVYPKALRKKDFYKSSYFGEFAFKRIRPIDGTVPYKARALGRTTPFLRKLDRSVLDDHIAQQQKFLNILADSKEVNLSKNHIPTMLAGWFKLNLGDSLRILGYHTERHYVQIDNLVNKRDE